MRQLFIAWAPRSGTTALAKYLNRHPELLVCIERYKLLPTRQLKPDLFQYDRILDFRPGETTPSKEQLHVKLLATKDPMQLKWIGDKHPHYFKSLSRIAANNPGSRFLVLYRPVEEVAESFEARAMAPNDPWPRHNGFAAGIDLWNWSLRSIRNFIRLGRGSDVIVVDYHRFFSDPRSYAPMFSDLLETEFGEGVLANWERMSRVFAGKRRAKHDLSPEQRALVEEKKDTRAEEWILRHIEQGGYGSSGRLAPVAEGATRRVRTLARR